MNYMEGNQTNDVNISVGLEIKGFEASIKRVKSLLGDATPNSRLFNQINTDVIFLESRLKGLKSSVTNNLKLPKDFSSGFTNINAEIQALSSTTEIAGKKFIKLGTAPLLNTKKSVLPSNFESTFTNINAEIKDLGTNSKQFIDGQMVGATKRAVEGLKKQEVAAKLAAKEAEKLRVATEKAQKEANKGFLEKKGTPFQGWAMSMMFFGMALQRIFDSIWKSSLKTFNDISHSVKGTITNSDQLNASFTYLGFVVGQALEPVVGFIIPIIEAMSEWISEHPQLTALIVTLGSALGALFTVGGAGFLAIKGFADLGVQLGLLAVENGKFVMTEGLAGFLATPGLGLIVAGLIALGAITWTAFNKTPAAWKAVMDAIGPIKTALGEFWDNLKQMVESILPDFANSWEDLAWLMAWAFSVVAEPMKFVINMLSLVVNGVSTLANGLNAVKEMAIAMWEALLSGGTDVDFSKAYKLLETSQNNFVKAIQNSLDMGKNVVDFNKLLFEGPEGMKQKREELQKIADIQNKINQENKDLNVEVPLSNVETLALLDSINSKAMNLGISQGLLTPPSLAPNNMYTSNIPTSTTTGAPIMNIQTLQVNFDNSMSLAQQQSFASGMLAGVGVTPAGWIG